MRIRSGCHEDVLSIGRIAEAGCWDSYAGLLKPETIGRFLTTAYSPGAVSRRLLRGGVMVVETERGISGFVDTVAGSSGLTVSAILTEPTSRRRGLGRALLTEVLHQHDEVAWSVDLLLGNLDAEGFFEQLGFVPGEVVPGSWFDEEVVERRWWGGLGRLPAAR